MLALGRRIGRTMGRDSRLGKVLYVCMMEANNASRILTIMQSDSLMSITAHLAP